MLDTIMILCWAFVYALAVNNYIRYPNDNRICIPFLAVIMNIGWEMNALIVSGGAWGHVLWLVLDLGIFAFGVFKILKVSSAPSKYICLYIVLGVLSFRIFFDIFRYQGGMLLSSFVINLLMSLMFIFVNKQIMPHFKLLIAGLKMVGSL